MPHRERRHTSSPPQQGQLTATRHTLHDTRIPWYVGPTHMEGGACHDTLLGSTDEWSRENMHGHLEKCMVRPRTSARIVNPFERLLFRGLSSEFSSASTWFRSPSGRTVCRCLPHHNRRRRSYNPRMEGCRTCGRCQFEGTESGALAFGSTAGIRRPVFDCWAAHIVAEMRYTPGEGCVHVAPVSRAQSPSALPG